MQCTKFGIHSIQSCLWCWTKANKAPLRTGSAVWKCLLHNGVFDTWFHLPKQRHMTHVRGGTVKMKTEPCSWRNGEDGNRTFLQSLPNFPHPSSQPPLCSTPQLPHTNQFRDLHPPTTRPRSSTQRKRLLS
jgi:hypothetical protein